MLREGRWKVAVTLYGRRVVDVHAATTDAPALYGVAVDIGTSKVIVYLFDLARGALIDQEAVENPQMRYGEDVISRIDAGRSSTTSRRELARGGARGHQRRPEGAVRAPGHRTPTTSAT